MLNLYIHSVLGPLLRLPNSFLKLVPNVGGLLCLAFQCAGGRWLCATFQPITPFRGCRNTCLAKIEVALAVTHAGR